MALTATYDSSLARVRLSESGLVVMRNPVLRRAWVQRSIDSWVTAVNLRGGYYARVASDGDLNVDDYEFAPGALNSYRLLMPHIMDPFNREESAGGWDVSDTGETWVTSGGSSSNFYVTEAAGGIMDITTTNVDRIALLDGTSILDSVVSCTINFPYLAISADYVAGIFARYQDSDNWVQARLTAAASDDNFYLSIVRRVAGVETESTPVNVGTVWGTAAYTMRVKLWLSGGVGRAKAWTGNNEPSYWQATMSNVQVVTAGEVGLMARRDTGNTNPDNEFIFTDFIEESEWEWLSDDDVTPELSGFWVKSVARPFLNRAFTVQDSSEFERAGRGAAFQIVNRTLPIGITEVGSSRSFQLVLLTQTSGEAALADYLAASGDVLFLQDGDDCGIPTGYWMVQRYTQSRTRRSGSARRLHSFDLIEVAKPGAAVHANSVTWQGLQSIYAAWATVVADNPTWLDVLSLVSDPSEVIVE